MLPHHRDESTFSRHLNGRHRNIRLIFWLCPLRELISDCFSNPVLHVSFHFTYSRCARWHFNRASNQVVSEGVCSGEEGCWGAALLSGLYADRYHGESLLSKPPRSQLLTSRAHGHLNSTAVDGREDFSPFVLVLSVIIPRHYPLFIWLYFTHFWPFPLPCVVKSRLIVPLWDPRCCGIHYVWPALARVWAQPVLSHYNSVC